MVQLLTPSFVRLSKGSRKTIQHALPNFFFCILGSPLLKDGNHYKTKKIVYFSIFPIGNLVVSYIYERFCNVTIVFFLLELEPEPSKNL